MSSQIVVLLFFLHISSVLFNIILSVFRYIGVLLD